jgi:hypothetical protein
MKTMTTVMTLVVGAAFLGATILREPIAHAAQFVNVSIVDPVDAQGNVKVHEQGTLIVRDPEAAHEPWHMFLGPADVYTVPAGKRLVIEYVNGIAQLVGATQPDWTLEITESAGAQGYHFAGTSLFNCANCYVVSQQIRAYASGGGVVRVGTVPTGSVLRVSGYLVDIE